MKGTGGVGGGSEREKDASGFGDGTRERRLKDSRVVMAKKTSRESRRY